MSTFLSRLKSNQTLGIGASSTSPVKSKAQDAHALSLDHNPLDDVRPVRYDGSDKTFGMHNSYNTCYANSVLQCLFFSPSFRNQLLNYPVPAHPRSILKSPALKPQPGKGADDAQPTVAGAGAPSPLRLPANGRNTALQRSTSNATTPGTSTSTENKDSFDPLKKQLMAAGPHVRDYEPHYEQYGMPESLYTSLKDLFTEISTHASRTGIVVPQKFLDFVRIDHAEYRSNQHQDAHEFFNLLLNELVDCVEDHTKKLASSQKELQVAAPIGQAIGADSSSWLRDMFQGTLTSETRCLSCENVSQRDEIFLDLSVDLEEHSSVSSCLQRFSQEETLCEDDKFHCDQCGGLQVAEKRMKIRKLPKTLALHMKRFKYVEETQSMMKLFHRVVFPFHLRLFNTTDDAEDPDRIYELYAVLVHLGTSPFHGHYVSIVKTPEHGWLLLDDELVLPVDANYVRNFFGGRGNACAYVLFYQETTAEAATTEQDRGQEGVTPHEPNIVKNSLLSPTTPGMEEAGFAFDTGSPRMRPTSPGQHAIAATMESSLEPQPATGELKEPKRSFELPPSVSGIFKKKSSEIDRPRPHAETSATQNGTHATPDESAGDMDDEKQLASRHAQKKSGGGLSRFRTTSFSVKGKSKGLFGSRSESKDQADEQSPAEPAVPSKIAEREKGSFSMMTRPKMFGNSKSERPEPNSEAMEEEQQAHEALLPSAPSAVPPAVKHEKEKSSFSKLWSRSDKDRSHKDARSTEPEPGESPDARNHDSPEKPIRHVSSRFGLGRKKSGNPLA